MMTGLYFPHVLITSALCGVIWMVQISHYPQFHYLDPERFKEAMLVHQGKISWVVIPLMIAELALSLFTLHLPSIAIVGLIWGSTFFIQVPLHDRLVRSGYGIEVVNKLIKTNWLRTSLWTLKLFLLMTNS